MIRKVERYQTADGKVLQSEQQAQRHAEELILHKLEVFVNHAFPDVGHRPSVIKAVGRLEGDRALTVGMLQELLYCFTYGEESE